MYKTTFEHRLELLTEVTDALDAMNEARERFMAEPGCELAYKELCRSQSEYQIAATALNHAIEPIQ